jgi:hypothetical protein
MYIREIAESNSKGETIGITGNIMLFVPCIVTYLCNVNQQNTHFSN